MAIEIISRGDAFKINNTYKSLKEHVYDYIVSNIQDGVLSPGQKISEIEICEALKISRTPVREALIQLSSEDIVENIPRRGFLVKQIDVNSKLEVYQIIGVLDALAASLAIDLLTEQDFKKMEYYIDIVDQAIQNQDYHEYQVNQYQFHNVYIQKCGNQKLIDLITSMQNGIIRMTYLSSNKDVLFNVFSQSNQEHKRILSYFKSKNREEIERFIKDAHWKITYLEMI